MIEAKLETATLTAGRDCHLVVVLSNLDRRVCRNIVFRLHLPPEIALLRGSERVELDKLDPGETHRLSLWVRPLRAGEFRLTSPNFSFLDVGGWPQRVSGWQTKLQVAEIAQTSAEKAMAEAERHERAGRLQEAWPLYVEAGQNERAWACLNPAIQALTSQSLYPEAAGQYLAWAQAMRRYDEPRFKHNSKAVASLERAVEWFARAQRQDKVNECRQLLAFIMDQPMLDARIIPAPDTVFVEGTSSLVTVEITNRGYGPARRVRLTLTGMLEQPDEQEIADVQVGQTVVWDSIGIVPSHHGPCVVKLHTVATPYGEGAPVTTSFRGVFPVQEAGLLDQIVRRKDAVVHLEIDTYVASGGTGVNMTDTIVTGRASVVGDSSQRSGATRSQSSRDLAKRYCPSCGAQTHSTHRFCSECGASLR